MNLSKIIAVLLLIHANKSAAADEDRDPANNKTQYFCQQDKCLTCVGRYCSTTCSGPACRQCPQGDCCGIDNDCNRCRRRLCCATPACNNCVNTCISKCAHTEPSCHFDCFKLCLPRVLAKIMSNPVSSVDNSLIGDQGRDRKLPFNVTTVINITNTVTKLNYVYNPILIATNNTDAANPTSDVRSVNINNNSSGDGAAADEPFKADAINVSKCCEIVHPEMCFNISGEDLCYTRKHRECSQLCSIASNIHIIRSNDVADHKCINISSYPYIYCGFYDTIQCDDCYNCTDYGKMLSECSRNPKCSDICRMSMKSEYNKVYNASSETSF